MNTEKEARELIGIAIGEASMCWERPGDSGVFLSNKASRIIDDLVVDLELKELSPDRMKVLREAVSKVEQSMVDDIATVRKCMQLVNPSWNKTDKEILDQINIWAILNGKFTKTKTETEEGMHDEIYELVEMAWGIIANSYGGDWNIASLDWQKAAANWRDKYHKTLPDDHDETLPDDHDDMEIDS